MRSNPIIGHGLSAFVALSSSLLAQGACAQTTRHITVNATVQTSTGQPLENVPVMFLEPSDRPVAKTNAQGLATLQGDITQSASEITVDVFGGGDDRLGSFSEQLTLTRSMKTLFEQYWFDSYTSVSLVAGQTECSVTITAWPTVQVSGTIVNQENEPMPELLLKADFSAALGGTNAVGVFTLAGVRQGTETQLFILRHGFSVIPIRVPASQTQSNTNLGQITLPTFATTAQFRATLTNLGPWGQTQESRLVGGLTLVAADGSILFTELAAPFGGPQTSRRLRTDPLSLPPGDYYIAPGFFAAGRVQVALVRACEQGMDLTATGIPKVTLVEGQTVDATVDLLAAYNAIREHIGFE